MSAAQVNDALREYYRGSAFVRVDAEPPKMKDIVATNYAAMHAVVDGDTLVVFCVTDNLLKGAAGGSIQWANRLLGPIGRLGPGTGQRERDTNGSRAAQQNSPRNHRHVSLAWN